MSGQIYVFDHLFRLAHSELPDVREDEIIIDVTTYMKYKRFEFDSREAINYRIGVPIKKTVNR